MLNKPAFCLAAALCLAMMTSRAQSTDSIVNKITNFPNKLFSKITGKATDLQQQLNRQTAKYLQRMASQEAKIRARLYKQDSLKAAALYPEDAQQQYSTLLQKFRQDSARVFHSMGPEYLPHVDSLNGALGFLSKNPNLLNANPALQSKMQVSLASVQHLQAKLQYADVVNQFIQARKARLQQVFAGYSKLPSGITNAFANYKQQAYYYSAQVKAYREMLNDPDKMMQTALVLLNKVPAFTSFMKQNSFLAGLFSVPQGYGTSQGLNGLQNRDQILSMVKSQISQGSSGGAAALQNSLNTAQQDINKLQNKLSSLGGGSENMDMPDFKANDQKTKTFLKRLAVGVDFQTTQTSYYYPTTANLGLSLGYKLNNSNVVGVGAAYKLGLGDGFQHIAFSNEGIGLRSFLQIKVKGTWGAAGGFEYNYQQPFASYQDIKNLAAWTKSGLIGATKTISMKSPVFRKTQLQLMWDFLSYQQVPKTQPFVFRVGYTF